MNLISLFLQQILCSKKIACAKKETRVSTNLHVTEKIYSVT